MLCGGGVGLQQALDCAARTNDIVCCRLTWQLWLAPTLKCSCHVVGLTDGPEVYNMWFSARAVKEC